LQPNYVERKFRAGEITCDNDLLRFQTDRSFWVNLCERDEGARPPFGFPDYWLYIDEAPVIHLVDTGNPTDDVKSYFEADRTESGSGAVDHVAFAYDAEDYDKTVAAIERLGFDCMRQTVRDLGQRQLFIKNPDAIMVELNFPAV